MVFSSYIFLLVFMPLVAFGFFALRAREAYGASVTFLLIASYVFYGYWSIAHLALLLGSIVANFWLGRIAATAPLKSVQRTAMIAGICFNLSLIFIFKYLDFTGSNLAVLFGANWPLLNLLLPIGISFFTFQQIAYLVDCYKTGTYENRWRDYALFVSFFPQLIAGPIVHHSHTRVQFAKLAKGPFNLEMLPYGLMIFSMGLFKKTIIADPIARNIDPLFALAANGDPLSALMSWTAMIGYTLQIYFDFSGYCDMAIGLGLMLGIRLPINFNSPYKATSIIDFWRRWHITLSNFLRDYVYIPFGGNRFGELFRLRNIFLTMVIGGIWHGAAWTFIIWGCLHAGLITINHAMRVYAPQFWRSNKGISLISKRIGTLAFVMIAWVFFRAENVPSALTVIEGLTAFTTIPSSAWTLTLAPLTLLVLALFAPNSLEITGYSDDLNKPYPTTKAGPKILRATPLAATATAIMLTCGIAVAWKPAVFIYFNF